MLRFILESFIFKRLVILSLLFIVVLYAASKIFDKIWGSYSSIPVVNLEALYAPPKQYDNFTGVNLKMISKDFIAIEGNKKFRQKNSNKDFDFYDTVKVFYPETGYDYANLIYLQFDDKNTYDSLFLVIASSDNSNIYYKQIFYSSVKIKKLNEFSDNPEDFRIKPAILVTNELLENNDTLINSVFNYFNNNIDNLGIAECGTNSLILQKICDDFGVPNRMINLQGGDKDQVGYYDEIGYPLHVVVEIYSSKHKKWYVVDPSYGFRFRFKSFDDYLNAAEICNSYAFHREVELEQDSILLTKRTLVGKDYFKYYENVIYSKPEWKNRYLKKAVSVFYGRFNYFLYLYSNNFPGVKNGFYYVGIKTFFYFLMLIIYINAVLLLLMRRLFLVKKPKQQTNI